MGWFNLLGVRHPGEYREPGLPGAGGAGGQNLGVRDGPFDASIGDGSLPVCAGDHGLRDEAISEQPAVETGERDGHTRLRLDGKGDGGALVDVYAARGERDQGRDIGACRSSLENATGFCDRHVVVWIREEGGTVELAGVG